MKPRHKLNGGCGATLCNNCSAIISIGHTDELFCRLCKGVEDLGKFDSHCYELIKEFPGSDELGTVHKYPSEVAGISWLGTETYDKFPEFWRKIDLKRKFLFKTEDQVDVYERDTYYAVVNDKEIQQWSTEKYFFSKVKKFSDLENAKSYLVDKVKLLTLTEVMEVYNICLKSESIGSFKDFLINKIKSKL
jgi:hypothetical protein